MEIKRDSWHYRMVKYYSYNDVYRINNGMVDSCAYIRLVVFRVLLSILFALLGLLVAGGVLSCFGDLLAWICFVVYNGYVPLAESGFVALALTITSVAVVGLVFCSMWIANGGDERVANAIDKVVDITFMSQAYDSIKNKFCSKVVLK